MLVLLGGLSVTQAEPQEERLILVVLRPLVRVVFGKLAVAAGTRVP